MCDKMGHKIQDVLQRIVEQEKAVCQVLSADPKTVHLKLKLQETEIMESIISVLLLVLDLTDVLSGEQHVTASCLISLITHLCKALNADAAHTSQSLKCDIKRKIREYRITVNSRGRKRLQFLWFSGQSRIFSSRGFTP